MTMTKAELEQQLQRAVEFGNEMIEYLEEMRDDPVIAAYRARMRDISRPFISSPTPTDPLNDLLDDEGEWDCFVGELQRAGVVDKELMAIDNRDSLVMQKDCQAKGD